MAKTPRRFGSASSITVRILNQMVSKALPLEELEVSLKDYAVLYHMAPVWRTSALIHSLLEQMDIKEKVVK